MNLECIKSKMKDDCVLEIIDIDKDYRKHDYIKVKCKCGNIFNIMVKRLYCKGYTKTCRKCCNRKLDGGLNNKHKRVYRMWKNIRARCYGKTSTGYKDYGALGIKMCDEWANNSVSFINWAYSNGYKDNLSIERIDVNGDYAPDNCCFIDIRKQEYNKHIRRDNTSKHNGLSYFYNKARKKYLWVAYIQYNKKSMNKSFLTFEEALAWRKQKEEELYKKYGVIYTRKERKYGAS